MVNRYKKQDGHKKLIFLNSTVHEALVVIILFHFFYFLFFIFIIYGMLIQQSDR